MTENQAAHALAVDADAASRYSMSRTLRRDGYVVIEAADGREALERIDQHEFDLTVTEIWLPDMDGIELLRQIKARSPEAIVILMTAAASLETAVEALRLGAWDYLLKPCSSQDLCSSVGRGIERARRLKRRRRLLDGIQRDARALAHEDFAQTPREAEVEPQRPLYRERASAALRLGPLTVFPGRYQAAAGGEVVSLTPTEFDLLLYLAAHRGRIVSCQELVREVRGYGIDESEAREVVRPHVSNLRGKLKGMGVDADLVVNVRGIGYRLGKAAEAD